MNAKTLEAQHVSVSIQRSAQDVYNFISNPANLPQWASGLSGSIQQRGEDWYASSPMGEVRIQFAPRNSFGVLDHIVTLPSGEKFNNPLRAIPNKEGTELVFTAFRWAGMDEAGWKKDAETIRKDLQTARQILEAGH